uniref:carbonic anhydrase n=1 Tax=Hanusia phi TaxID=3032 RepID=A0A7S0E1N4_9CRYP
MDQFVAPTSSSTGNAEVLRNYRKLLLTSLTCLGIVAVVVFLAKDGVAEHDRSILFSPFQRKQSLHWEFRGADGPATWGKYYFTCDVGMEQSPVNIESSHAEATPLPAMKWDFKGKMISVHQKEETYDSHKFDLEDQEKPTLQMEEGGPVYSLQQIQVHAPSENTIDGKQFDVEVQFWHMAPGPKYMVISSMLKRGGSSPLFVDQISKILQKSVFRYNELEPAISFESIQESLAPTGNMSSFFRFNGSLTQPPCTEGVVWNILRDPIPIFYYDADEIAQDLAPNNRPVQPLSDRVVQAATPEVGGGVTGAAAARGPRATLKSAHGSLQQSLLRLGKRNPAARGGSRESLKSEVHDIKEAESALIRKAEQIRKEEARSKAQHGSKEAGKTVKPTSTSSASPKQTNKHPTQLSAPKTHFGSQEQSLSQALKKLESKEAKILVKMEANELKKKLMK